MDKKTNPRQIDPGGAIKIPVYVPPGVLTFLGPRTSKRLSRRFSNIVDRYRLFYENEKQYLADLFTENEMRCLVNVYSLAEEKLDKQVSAIFLAIADVRIAFFTKIPDIFSRWNVDRAVLLSKIDGLSEYQQITLAEFVDQELTSLDREAGFHDRKD